MMQRRGIGAKRIMMGQMAEVRDQADGQWGLAPVQINPRAGGSYANRFTATLYKTK